MKAFTDTEGRIWSIRGSLGAFERAKTLTGVDMLDLPTTQNCLKEINNVFTLGRVLYAMCQDQVESRGLTPEQLARLHGPVGLEIGARTPPEIALAILAHMTAERYGVKLHAM